ncbi:MAG: 2Fe-2S iron-sulfur cluster binding domain-containing protein [Nitrospinaceae bacterium]|nr:(2Fe-2S)-binding protein [Nitrospinaceae bacterium]NIR55569.1 (2Fe-2S)-binding protein [Nitrospinaceae bacterium]NIS86003.1 (2Fe-2S)-binding protein [Nitrospinaceae bacterium]NIT82849.1 (2Fe-2S)-binding protein [Nitrospinaceae bacterium]NIU45051.1 (2Fe-2S)-binding protein [Nitrospinaceae bacterium]
MLNITFEKQNRTIQVESGVNLREAAIASKIGIYAHIFKLLNCRGRGLCSSCRVEIVSGNVAPRNDIENSNLAKALKKNPNLRLACQIEVTDHLVVRSHV